MHPEVSTPITYKLIKEQFVSEIDAYQLIATANPTKRYQIGLIHRSPAPWLLKALRLLQVRFQVLIGESAGSKQ